MSEQSNLLRVLNAAGQSVWCDNIQRDMLTSGELAGMVTSDDLRGITSNPSIFDKAITSGDAYDAQLREELAQRQNPDSRELFFALAVKDIQDAADVMRPVYDATDGVDGMISLEVSPDLAHDTDATVAEARALWARLARPNVMIKIPATLAGIPAIETLISEGLNINVTLLFAVERYEAVAEAFIRGLERRLDKSQSVARIASVASFFVSRVDAALDPLLAERKPQWQGQLAIANAKLAYARYQALFQGERFARLREAGALDQRLLWASTGTKNPAYSETLYVDSLIGPQTVNTMPPATYEAFRRSGKVERTLDVGVDEARAQIASLEALGIDLKAITDRLEAEGVAAFAKSFDNLLHHIQGKAERLAA